MPPTELLEPETAEAPQEQEPQQQQQSLADRIAARKAARASAPQQQAPTQSLADRIAARKAARVQAAPPVAPIAAPVAPIAPPVAPPAPIVAAEPPPVAPPANAPDSAAAAPPIAPTTPAPEVISAVRKRLAQLRAPTAVSDATAPDRTNLRDLREKTAGVDADGNPIAMPGALDVTQRRDTRNLVRPVPKAPTSPILPGPADKNAIDKLADKDRPLTSAAPFSPDESDRLVTALRGGVVPPKSNLDVLSKGVQKINPTEAPRPTSTAGKVVDMAGRMIFENPLQTAAMIAAPEVMLPAMVLPAAATLGKFSAQEQRKAQGDWQGPDVVSRRDAAFASGQLLLPGVASKALPYLENVFGAKVANAAVDAAESGESPARAMLIGWAARTAVHAGAGGAIGAVFSPDDMKTGALLGAALGGAHAAVSGSRVGVLSKRGPTATMSDAGLAPDVMEGPDFTVEPADKQLPPGPKSPGGGAAEVPPTEPPVAPKNFLPGWDEKTMGPKPTPEQHEAFKQRAIETLMKHLPANKGPVEPEPAPLGPGVPAPFSRIHSLIEYANGQSEAPPTNWQTIAPIDAETAKDFKLSDSDVAAANAALKMLHDNARASGTLPEPAPPAPQTTVLGGKQGLNTPEEIEARDKPLTPDQPLEPGPRKFPATSSTIVDYATDKKIGVDEAVAKLQAANYEVPDEAIQIAKRKLPRVPAAEEVNKPAPVEQKPAREQKPVAVADLPLHEVKSIVNVNGFGPMAIELSEAKGWGAEETMRHIVQKYRDAMDGGMSPKDAKGEVGADIKASIDEAQAAKAPAVEPSKEEAKTEEPVKPAPRLEAQADDELKQDATKAIERYASQQKIDLADGLPDDALREALDVHMGAGGRSAKGALIYQKGSQSWRMEVPDAAGENPRTVAQYKGKELLNKVRALTGIAQPGEAKPAAKQPEKPVSAPRKITREPQAKTEPSFAVGDVVRSNIPTYHGPKEAKIVAIGDDQATVEYAGKQWEVGVHQLSKVEARGPKKYTPEESARMTRDVDERLSRATVTYSKRFNTTTLLIPNDPSFSDKPMTVSLDGKLSLEEAQQQYRDRSLSKLEWYQPTKQEEPPVVTFKKAAIVPTRQGVKAIPIEEKAAEEPPTEAAKPVVVSGTKKERVAKRLEDKAAAALARIKARQAGSANVDEEFFGKGGKSMSSPAAKALDPEELSDYAIIGAAEMARGNVSLEDWSKSMVEMLGESVKPHLRKIFGASIQAFNDETEAVENEEQPAAVDEKPSTPTDIRKAEEPNESRDVRNNVEGGAEEQRPEGLQPTEGERGAGPDGEGGGREGRQVVPRSDVEPREGVPAAERVPAASEPPAQSGVNGERTGPEGPVTDERSGPEGVDTRVRGSEPKPKRADSGVKGTDYRITDADKIGKGGLGQKAKDNVAAIALALRISAEQRPATVDEQSVLAKYVGWGGLKPAFEPAGDKAFQKIHDQLKDLLSDDEFRAARASILNAHYTSPLVVSKMWEAVQRLGFKGGKVLEPSVGVGNFIGLTPESIKGKTHFMAVEKDRISALIASLLYPKQNVIRAPFEESNPPANYHDLVIGNIPFGDIPVYDRSLPKEFTSQLHDYFLVRPLQTVRPGGLLAVITSDGSLDKQSATVRKELAKQARLIAAFRLPNNAFKENANTQVTTDIVILQRRLPDDTSPGQAFEKLVDFKTENGTFRINEYFGSHPGNMLGHLEKGGQYGLDDQKLVADEYIPFEEMLTKAIETLPKNILTPRKVDTRTADVDEGSQPLPANAQVRDGGLTVVGDKIMRRVGNTVVDSGVPKSRFERVKALIGIRDAVNEVRLANRENASDQQLADAQRQLKKQYGAFVKEYGPINMEERTESEPDEDGETTLRITYPNLRSFEHDPDAPFVRALEKYEYEDHIAQGEKYRPELTDIVSTRQIAPREARAAAETATDAVLFSLNEKGVVDLPYMAELLGKSDDAVREELKGRIYNNPETGQWETDDQYLSGDVKKKLSIAEEAQDEAARQAKRLRKEIAQELAKNPEPNIGPKLTAVEGLEAKAAAMTESVEALKKAIPADLPPSKINAVLGAPWVPPTTVMQFATEMFGLREDPGISYSPYDARWVVTSPKWAGNSLKNLAEFGTKRAPAIVLLQHALNMTHPTITDDDGAGGRVKNVKETLLAEDKLEKMKDEFSRWMWKDGARAEKHVRLYNDHHNTTVLPHPDGSHLVMPGIATTINGRTYEWQPHQRNFIARFLYWGRAAAFHVVGAGKTFAAIGAIMEGKRLGFVNKAMVAVPNHMLGQWTREWLQLYPGANLLVATEHDFKASRRREFTARIASSNYDAIIITHSAFEKIQMSREAQERHIQEELDDLEQVIRSMKEEASGKRGTGSADRMVKDLEKAKEKLLTRLKQLNAAYKKDDLLDFEELGVDHLTVDEAHMFKNLNFNTTLRGVRGRPSQRATDLEMKLKYLHGINPKHSAMLLTGTPISNSFSEAYVMQRYMQPELLKERGLFPFDAWAKTFARERMAFEMKPSGDGFKQKSRFDKFVNLGEFAQMFRMFADVQMAHPEPLLPGQRAQDFPVEPNFIRLERPPLVTGKPEIVTVPKTPELVEFMKALIYRAKNMKKSWKPQKGDDNMLAVTNDGRLAALDLRTVQANAPDLPDGKLSVAAKKIAAIYHETAHLKGTQLVFCDILRSSKTGLPGFEVYRDLVDKLVAQGVKRNEIAIVHDHDSAIAKMKLFLRVRSGDIRVLLGSTEKMGAGTNVQTRLVAEHQLDVRWRPSDVEQRNGRILRQGNELYNEGKIPGVRILPYVTEGSLDAFMWGMSARKAGMIHQGLTADANTREIEDVDEQAMTLAEIAAAASGDPRIMRRAQVDAEVQKLERLRRGHADELWERQRDVKNLPVIIEERKKLLDGLKQDAQKAIDAIHYESAEDQAEGKKPEARPKQKFAINIHSTDYTSRMDANKALVDIIKAIPLGQGERLIGKFGGFSLYTRSQFGDPVIGIEGKARYEATPSLDRPVASVEALPNQIPRAIEEAKEDVALYEQRLAEAQQRINTPFEHEKKLEELKKELSELNLALSEKEEGAGEQEAQPPTRTEEDDIDDEFYGEEGDEPPLSLSPASRRARADLGGMKRGPSMSALNSPAAEETAFGARVRGIFGMNAASQAASVDRIKSLRTITMNLSKMVNLPIRQGRFMARQRAARGVFFVKPEVARVVRMDMLDVAAHEVGHYVSKHYLGTPTRRVGKSPSTLPSAANLPKLTPAMKKELVRLGKDLYGTRRPNAGYGEEGIAEWTNFYVTAPGKMATEAPEFTHWMEQYVLSNEPGLKAALDQTRQDFVEYKKAPATARIDAMLDVKPTNRWMPTARGIVSSWFDDLAEVKNAVQELGGAENAAKDAYILARLTRGGAGVAEEMVMRGVVDADGQRVTRGVQEILADVGKSNMQKFRRYLIAERALEFWDRGVDSGIDRNDAQVVADQYRDQFGELAHEIWDISNALIRYRESKGLLMPDEASSILENNQKRVGFFRVFEDEESVAQRGVGRGFARNSSGLARAKGSSRAIIDPLESVITDIYRTVQQSHAAEVMSALVKHAEDTEGGGRVLEILTDNPKRIVKTEVEKVKWQLQELGIQVPRILDYHPEVLQSFEPVNQARGVDAKDLVMPLVVDGRRRWIQLKDRRLYEAISGLGTPVMPVWLRWVSVPTRVLRAGATLTAEFIGRNPVRDAWTAAVFSRAGTRPPGWDFARGMFHVLSEDKMYQDWRLDGADNAAMLGLDRVDIQKHVQDLMRSKTARSTGWVLHPIDTLRMLSSLFENATRLGEYSAMRGKAEARGVPEKVGRTEAAIAARDVTIDFSQAGTIGRQVNQIVSFFNANVRGWAKLKQEMEENPGQTAARILAFITIPSLLLWLKQRDDDEYKKVPEWQKALAWVIIDRDADGNLKHIWRIPKPPELGLLFGTMPVKVAEWMTDRDPRAMDHFEQQLGNFSPLHLPDALQPIVEWWANKNAFTGRQIVPEGIAALPPGEQATSRTGEFARQIGRATSLPPAKVENTIKDYAGGLGQYGMDIGNMVVRAGREFAGADPFPRPPESSDEKLTKVPLVRGFTIRKPGLDAQPIQDALDAFTRADGKRMEWRRRVESGDPTADKYLAANKAEIESAAGSTDGLNKEGESGGVGALRMAHDAIVDAQRAARDADPETRDSLAQAAVRAAQAALKDQTPETEDRRQLRRGVNAQKSEGIRRLKRSGQ